MRCEIVRHAEALAGLAPAWAALWRESGARPATLHPAWSLAWWQCFGGAEGGAGAFHGELLAIAAWQGRDLVGITPLFVAPPRGGTLRSRELKLVGDNLVGMGQAILALPGEEGRVRDVVAEALAGETSWDLFDLTLAQRASGGRLAAPMSSDVEALGLRFAAMGRAVERLEARGRAATDLVQPWAHFADTHHLPASEPPPSGEWDARALTRGLLALRALLAGPGERSPAPRPPDAALLSFLERALPPLVEAGVASLGLLRSPAQGFAAAGVVLSDGERRMELLRVSEEPPASERMLTLELRRAVDEGASRFEFAGDSILSSGRAPGLRLRVFSRAAASMLERGYASIMRRAVDVADSAVARVRGPIDTIRGLRDAASVTRAVGRVATFARLHLYRGELFVDAGSPPPPPFATIRLFGLPDFAALSYEAKHRFLERLDLVEGYCRQKWERGDLVVAAFHQGPAGEAGASGQDPIGILWCARGPVFVPDIGREVKPAHGESYIHDVYVAPDARGRAVAPAMLEFLARELRRRDVYRAWALIERSNTASTRAFEKARWASVADVIYARMGTTSRLLVRPPDAEARKFVGLTR